MLIAARIQNRVSELVGNFCHVCMNLHDWPFVYYLSVCPCMLDILVGHLGEMHPRNNSQWPPVILYSVI